MNTLKRDELSNRNKISNKNSSSPRNKSSKKNKLNLISFIKLKFIKLKISPLKLNTSIMTKSGMGVGEVFIFIIAALTFVLIMIFGYKAISGFLEKGETVAFVQFKTDLENSVKEIYTEYGAVRIEPFQAPAEHTQICFVNMDATDMSGLETKDSYAYDTWRTAQEDFQARPGLRSAYDATEQNVFLTPPSISFKVYKITINDQGNNYLCLPLSDGSFKLVLEGKGDHTELSRAED